MTYDTATLLLLADELEKEAAYAREIQARWEQRREREPGRRTEWWVLTWAERAKAAARTAKTYRKRVAKIEKAREVARINGAMARARAAAEKGRAA